MAAPADQTVLAVFRQIAFNGPVSRVALAEATGLGRASISSIVAELIRRQLVEETSREPIEGRGRPTRLLDVDDEAFAIAGLDIGQDTMLAGLYSLRGRLIQSLEQDTSADSDLGRAQLRRAAESVRILAQHCSDHGIALVGAGVSFGGLVDAKSGTVKFAPTMSLQDKRLTSAVIDALSPSTQVVRLDTSANFAALAESRFRTRLGAPAEMLVHLSGTYGITAGLMTECRLIHGARGMAGEVGHLMLDGSESAPRCHCGRIGCFDALASVATILHSALAAEQPTSSATLAGLRQQVERVRQLASRGNREVIASLQESARWLGRGAAQMASIFDPNTIVLGGHYAPLAPWLLEPAREAFGAALLNHQDPPRLEVSALDAWAPTVGAALSVLAAVANGEEDLPDL